MKKRLRCRLGIHSWFHDSAMFVSVRRCNYCSSVDNELAAQRLERERQFWIDKAKKEG